MWAYGVWWSWVKRTSQCSGMARCVEALALGDAANGIEIVAHDPGDVEMGAGGDEVGDVTGVLTGGLDVDGEQLRGVAGETFDGDAGDDGVDLAGRVDGSKFSRVIWPDSMRGS